MKYQKTTLYYRLKKAASIPFVPIYEYEEHPEYVTIPIFTDYPCLIDAYTIQFKDQQEFLRTQAASIFHGLFLKRLNFKPIYNRHLDEKELQYLEENGNFFYLEDGKEVSLIYKKDEEQIKETITYFIRRCRLMVEYLAAEQERSENYMSIVQADEALAIQKNDWNYIRLYANDIFERLASSNRYYAFYRNIQAWKPRKSDHNTVTIPDEEISLLELTIEEESQKLTKEKKNEEYWQV